jgi:hypothetical protein
LLCVVTFFWVNAKIPETKGKSLEQIQSAWAEHDTTARRRDPPTPSTEIPAGI